MKKPTFLLKPSAYKTDKLYAITPTDGTGDMTVSSYVGNGTRVNPQGFIETVATDTPRLDHLGKPGVLVEPTRVNQCLSSGSITGGGWTGGVTTTDNDTIAPDGTLSADRAEDDQVTLNDLFQQVITVSDNTAIHTISLFCKFGNSDSFDVELDDGISTASFIQCNSDGTTTAISGAGITSSGSEKYPNDWIRFWFVYDMNNTATTITYHVYPASSQDVDKQGYHWFWGFQLEEGRFMTSYIPTTGTTVTRTVDVLTGASLVVNNFIGVSNGAFFIDYEKRVSPGNDSIGLLWYIGATNGIVQAYSTSSNPDYASIRVQNTDTTINTHVLTQERNRVLFNLYGDDTQVWVNGIKQITTAADMFLTAEDLKINGTYGVMKIYETALFDKTLTDSEAQAITS